MITTVRLDQLLPATQYFEREGIPVLSPQTTEEIAAIARHADQNSLTIEIVGAGTKRTWSSPVQPNLVQPSPDLLLDTTRLNRVLEHPWQDLTCTVQAGCTWSAMQQILAQHKQFVALDPLWPTRATVGGIVATNDSGALRHRYGSFRDLIIGMTIVLADGTIARSGGKVVKNVAGYDLHKLMTGAFGTLGIIAEVTFRLHPLPLHAQTFTVAAPQAAQLAPLIAAIRDSHLLTQALQLRGDSEGFHLDIQLNAHPTANQPTLLASMAAASEIGLESRQSDAVVSEIGLGFSPGTQAANNPGFSPRDTPSFTPQPHLAPARESLFHPNATTIKLSVSPSELCDYLDHMQWAPNIEVTCVAQSIGIIYASLVGPSNAIEAYLQSLKTDFTILASPLNLDDLKSTPSALPLMRTLKHQFDPNRTLNPNRFLGGI